MLNNPNIFYKKKILIYGLGKSGLSVYKFLKKDNQIIKYDDKIKSDIKQITKIKSALVELKTNAVVQNHILLIINSWLSNIPITLPPVTTEFPSILLRRAYEEQVDIGISGFFKGIISTKWGDIQETDYYRLHRNSTFNRIRWEKKLITIL